MKNIGQYSMIEDMFKVLFVVTDCGHGGISRSLQNLCPYLEKREVRVSIFALNHEGAYLNVFPKEKLLPEDKWVSLLIKNHRIQNGLTRCLVLIVKLLSVVMTKVGLPFKELLFKRRAKVLSNMGFDAIVAFSEGVPTRFVSFMKGKNLIAWIHCDYANYKRLNNNIDERNTYERYNSIVCVSEYTRKVFCQLMPSVSNRVHAIYNVLDSDMMISLARLRIDDKNFVRDNFTIVSVGRIDPVKRFSEIPFIAAKLKQASCRFKWYIIGGSGVPAERELLMHNVALCEVEDCVIYLGEKDNPYYYIRNSELLVNTSLSEACPYVVNEAKILHKPVVCTDFGSAEEFIENGVNGYISPIEKIHEPIISLIKRRELYDRMVSSASDFAYNNESIVDQIVGLFN